MDCDFWDAALVAIAGTILATTHWCLGSFYYRLIFRRAAGTE